MNIITIYNNTKKQLKNSNIDSFELDARILIENATGIAREDFILSAHTEIPAIKLKIIHNFIKRRIAGEPVSRIIGKREFYGLEFKISSETLDPRPDTETIITSIIDNISNRDKKYEILDLGTGSGCILLTLLSEFKNSIGTGIDISKDAINTANINAKNLGLEKRAKFINISWNDKNFKKNLSNYDIIVSNPPYIPSQDIASLKTEVKDFDPIVALDGGNDGLDCYRDLANIAPNLLKKDALLAVEIGYTQANSVCRIFEEANFSIKSVKKDLSGHNRCILATKKQ